MTCGFRLTYHTSIAPWVIILVPDPKCSSLSALNPLLLYQVNAAKIVDYDKIYVHVSFFPRLPLSFLFSLSLPVYISICLFEGIYLLNSPWK